MRFLLPLTAMLLLAPYPVLAQSLILGGSGGETVALDAPDLEAFPQETVDLESHGAVVTYAGPLLFELLGLAGAPESAAMHGAALAKVVRITASDGYQVVLSLGETDPGLRAARTIVVAPQALVDAHRAAGFRVIVEDELRPARSVYGVTRIEILDLGQALPRAGSHH